jgi:glycosyltransferase involved in cell wall biosynthesis
VRSVQPELSYLAHNLRGGLARPSPSFALAAFDAPLLAWRVVRGLHAGSAVLCLTDSEVEDWARRFPRLRSRLKRYRVAPSVEEQRLLRDVAHKRPHGPRGATRFLWIGRWARHKGTHLLAPFTCRWLEGHPADTLTIGGCGDSPDADLRELSRIPRVRLLPTFRRSELPELLISHDIGLFTSVSEGWGLSLNEMLESGMPVYATNAGGVPELRNYFRSQLRPFPPHGGLDLGPPDNPTISGYDNDFAWATIAERYEKTAGSVLNAFDKEGR